MQAFAPFYNSEDVIPEPAFRPSYLHDLESLWWIGMWPFFTMQPKLSPSPQQMKHIPLVFPRSVTGSEKRLDFFVRDKTYLGVTEDLPDTFRPRPQAMSDLRISLQSLYQIFAEEYTPAKPSFDDYKYVYDGVICQFAKAAERPTNEDLIVVM